MITRCFAPGERVDVQLREGGWVGATYVRFHDSDGYNEHHVRRDDGANGVGPDGEWIVATQERIRKSLSQPSAPLGEFKKGDFVRGRTTEHSRHGAGVMVQGWYREPGRADGYCVIEFKEDGSGDNATVRTDTLELIRSAPLGEVYGTMPLELPARLPKGTRTEGGRVALDEVKLSALSGSYRGRWTDLSGGEQGAVSVCCIDWATTPRTQPDAKEGGPEEGETWEAEGGHIVTLGRLLPCGKCHDGHDGIGAWRRPGEACGGVGLLRRISPASTDATGGKAQTPDPYDDQERCHGYMVTQSTDARQRREPRRYEHTKQALDSLGGTELDAAIIANRRALTAEREDGVLISLAAKRRLFLDPMHFDRRTPANRKAAERLRAEVAETLRSFPSHDSGAGWED